MSEALKREVVKALKELNIPVARTNSGKFSRCGRHIQGTPKGYPDLWAFPRSGVLAIECKQPKEELEPEQEEWRRIVVAAGARHVTAKTVDDVLVKIPKR